MLFYTFLALIISAVTLNEKEQLIKLVVGPVGGEND